MLRTAVILNPSELVTCMLLRIELREPLANNAIDLIGLLKLSPMGSG
jgi:hypothetical protein